MVCHYSRRTNCISYLGGRKVLLVLVPIGRRATPSSGASNERGINHVERASSPEHVSGVRTIPAARFPRRGLAFLGEANLRRSHHAGDDSLGLIFAEAEGAVGEGATGLQDRFQLAERRHFLGLEK